MTPNGTNGTPEGHAVCAAWCDQCGCHTLGVDPGFLLPIAAMLIPCTLNTLRRHLSTHRAAYPARYVRRGTKYHHRVVYASEVRQIRASMLRVLVAPGSRKMQRLVAPLAP